MKEIIDSIINGQRKQALRQLENSKYSMADLLQELLDLELQEEVVKIMRVAERTEYVKYIKKAVKDY